MKSRNLIFIMMFALAISMISCDKFGSGNWAARIDDETISIDDFNRFYYTQNKLLLNLESKDDVDRLAAESANLNPQLKQYLLKPSFLDHLVAQKLLYSRAMKDKAVNREELDTIIEIAKMQAVATYFLGVKLRDKISVSDQEVEMFYNQNRKLFNGVPMNEQVINRIKQQIFMQKSNQASNEYIMDLLAEAKVNKEGFKHYMQSLEKEKKPAPQTAPAPMDDKKPGVNPSAAPATK
jgi:hypothetical protein